jgi:hypothetical protein
MHGPCLPGGPRGTRGNSLTGSGQGGSGRPGGLPTPGPGPDESGVAPERLAGTPGGGYAVSSSFSFRYRFRSLMPRMRAALWRCPLHSSSTWRM